MENLYAQIGQRIVQIRRSNNLTQYQLAEISLSNIAAP